jgi:hypothetical protein
VQSRRRVGEVPDEHGGSGVTGLGAIVLLVVISLVGAGVDELTGLGLRLAFSVCLVLGAVLAAAAVRRRDVLMVVLAPPLVYLGVSALFVIVSPDGGARGALLDAAAGWLVYGFPAMATATGAAAIVAAVRGRRD